MRRISRSGCFAGTRSSRSTYEKSSPLRSSDPRILASTLGKNSGIRFVRPRQPTFSAACSHVRCQEFRRGLSSPAFAELNCKQSDAHGRRQRLKTPVNKLSCAGWLPHDRDSVSGCLVLGTSVGTWPAHNRSRGFPAVALPPAVGAWESDDSWVPSCWSDRARCDCQTARG